MQKKKLTAIDLFSGAGGLHIGFENAFEIVNMITLLSFEELELLTETCNLVFGIIDMYRNPELIFTEKSKNTSPGNSCQE